MKCQKRADAADCKGDDQRQRKGRAFGDEAHPVADGLHRMRLEMTADPLGREPKQRLSAKTEGGKSSDQAEDAPRSAVPELGMEDIRGLRELCRHGWHDLQHAGDVLAHRLDARRHHRFRRFEERLGGRLVGRSGLALILEPRLHLGIGEQVQERLNFRGRGGFRRRLRAI